MKDRQMKLLALMLTTLFVAGCAQSPTCERPYMHTPIVPCEDCEWNEK